MSSQGHGGPNPGARSIEGDVAKILRICAPGERLAFSPSGKVSPGKSLRSILNGIPGQDVEVH